MSKIALRLSLALLLFAMPADGAASPVDERIVVLIGLYGFRWDYLGKFQPLNLSQAPFACGAEVSARSAWIRPRTAIDGSHVFIASGPAFKEGVTIPAFKNVEMYDLLCTALGLKAAPNDGLGSLSKKC